jgi:hypothetical protein
MCFYAVGAPEVYGREVKSLSVIGGSQWVRQIVEWSELAVEWASQIDNRDDSDVSCYCDRGTETSAFESRYRSTTSIDRNGLSSDFLSV